MSKIGLSQKGYYLANLGHFGLFFHIFRFLEAISLREWNRDMICMPC